MPRLFLRVRAPFAAFRWMQAGVYRATSPVVPPSAAWGLILNLAGVEIRAPSEGVTTTIRTDAPPLRLAVATLQRAAPEVTTLYQQLHTYPVGNSGKELKERAHGAKYWIASRAVSGASPPARKERAHGAKYWIAPARRELLVGFDALLGIETADGTLLDRVCQGLAGTLDGPRYGVPFAGDNNLLIDRIDAYSDPLPAYWYERLEAGMGPRSGSCRLTIGIDREDSSRTTSSVFAPIDEPIAEPPGSAWSWTPHAPV